MKFKEQYLINNKFHIYYVVNINKSYCDTLVSSTFSNRDFLHKTNTRVIEEICSTYSDIFYI